MKIHVVTILTDAGKSTGEDPIGPHIEQILKHHYPDCIATRSLIELTEEHLLDVFKQSAGVDIIITSGGIGLKDSDTVPEITAGYCDRLISGIAEMLRCESLKHSPYASLSRGVAGIKDKTIIINIPGSLKAALFSTRLLIPIIGYSPKMLAGEIRESFEPGVIGKG